MSIALVGYDMFIGCNTCSNEDCSDLAHLFIADVSRSERFVFQNILQAFTVGWSSSLGSVAATWRAILPTTCCVCPEIVRMALLAYSNMTFCFCSTCAVPVGASSNYCIGTYNWGVVSVLMQRCSSRFRLEVCVQRGYGYYWLSCVCTMMAHGTVVVVVNCCWSQCLLPKRFFVQQCSNVRRTCAYGIQV